MYKKSFIFTSQSENSENISDVENDLRELKVNRWRQKVNSKEELASVSKKAKVLRGL
jgi:hypothetical protein